MKFKFFLFFLINFIFVIQKIRAQIHQQQQQQQQQQYHHQNNLRHRSNYNHYYNNNNNTTTTPNPPHLQRTFSSSSSSSSSPSLPSAPTTTTTITSNEIEEFLKRIHDQVMKSTRFNEIQFQKLENIGNKLESFEMKNRDQLNAIQNEIKTLERRIHNVEWMTEKTETNLNQLRGDYDVLRHNYDGSKIKQSNVGKRDQQSVFDSSPSSSVSNVDDSEKLEALATLLTSTRAAISKLEKQVNMIERNVINVSNVTGEISQRQNNLATKQYLLNTLNTIRPYQQTFYSGNPIGPTGQFSNGNGGGITSLPPSCSHVSITSSGVLRIQINSSKQPFYVMCEDNIQDGGWTVILNRKDGTINFNRNWLEYKFGFGNIAGEYFIGLDKLHDITSTMLHELLIVMEDFDGVKKYAKYKQFAIGSENEDYALILLGDYEGDAGDSLSYSASYKFSTFDNDNDGWVEGNCALAHTGAWWYNACEMSNLNGQYLGGAVSDANTFQGMYWNEFRGPKYSLKSAKMMIRPVDRIFV